MSPEARRKNSSTSVKTTCASTPGTSVAMSEAKPLSATATRCTSGSSRPKEPSRLIVSSTPPNAPEISLSWARICSLISSARSIQPVTGSANAPRIAMTATRSPRDEDERGKGRGHAAPVEDPPDGAEDEGEKEGEDDGHEEGLGVAQRVDRRVDERPDPAHRGIERRPCGPADARGPPASSLRAPVSLTLPRLRRARGHRLRDGPRDRRRPLRDRRDRSRR